MRRPIGICALLAVILFLLAGCANMPSIGICYVHPVYGQVCVKIGGKKYYDESLTPAQKEEIDRWLKEQDNPR